jgi:hypothetical protein
MLRRPNGGAHYRRRPVADPQGYLRELLALLGTSDPLEVLAATPAAIQQRTTLLAGEALGRRPAAGEWSVTELVGHLWDAEIAYAFRARLILTRDRARLIGYDQEAWARLARPPFAELVVAFTALRTANLVLIRGTPVTWVGPTGHPRGARADQLSLCHRDHRRPRPGPPAAARPDDHRAAALTIVYIPLHSSVGVPGFEPGAFGSQSRRANQAAPYPVALPAVS